MAPGQPVAAVEDVAGIEVTASGRDWVGNPEVTTYVTPIRLQIDNKGKVPLRVRYSEIAVITGSGLRHSALPPMEVTGTVEQQVAVRTDVVHPGFYHRHFRVAPYYRDLYPDLDYYPDTFAYDPYYNDYYYQYWQTVGLPTERMIELALPEGVVEPGGEVSGWVYVELIDPKVESATFRMDLVNADTGRLFGEIKIPFLVQKARV